LRDIDVGEQRARPLGVGDIGACEGGSWEIRTSGSSRPTCCTTSAARASPTRASTIAHSARIHVSERGCLDAALIEEKLGVQVVRRRLRLPSQVGIDAVYA